MRFFERIFMFLMAEGFPAPVINISNKSESFCIKFKRKCLPDRFCFANFNSESKDTWWKEGVNEV